jgi:hypothetical protein
LIVSAGPRASIATFTFQVTARSGSFTHNANLTVTIAAGTADFAIMLSPSLVSVVPGGSATSTITVQSLGVFFSPVQLVSSGAPDGMTLVFAANPVTPPIGGIASSTLSVIASGAPEGTYTITVIGTGGSLTRDSVLTVQVAGGCLIATATYGSELSGEVQFLRNFRDRLILKTNTGSSFMVAFNAWYYSFSPTVARLIREHSVAKATTRLALYPLIGILRIGVAAFDVLATYPEAGVVLSGLVISARLGMAYFAIPLTALLAFSSTARRISRQLRVPALLVLLGALVTVAFNGAIGGPAALMTIATSTVVLACLVTSTFFASHALLHIVKLR